MKEYWTKAALVLFGVAALGALLASLLRMKAAPSNPLVYAAPSDLKAAERCVRKLGPRSIPLLLEEVKAGNRLRADIVTALSALGPVAVPQLVAAFADDSSLVRLAAVRTFLSLSGDVEGQEVLAAPALLNLMRDPDVEVRYVAALAWRRMGAQRVRSVPAMIESLRGNKLDFEDDDSLCLRIVAAQSLGQLGPEAVDAVPALLRILADAPSAVCKEGLVSLWRITQDATWFNAELSQMLTAPDFRIRSAASVAVRRLRREAPLSPCVIEAAELIREDGAQPSEDGI